MAILYVAELSAIGGGGNHPISGAQWPPINEQIIVIGGGSANSTTLNNNTTLLRINCDSSCSIAIGLNAIATTANARMSAGQTEYFSVPPNSGYRVAVVFNS